MVHRGEHGNIGVEADQQRRGLVVMFDDQRGTAFLQRLENGIEVTGQFRSRNDFEHDAIVDRRQSMVKQDRFVMSAVLLMTLIGCQPAPRPAVTPSPTASVSRAALFACPATPASSAPQTVLANLPAPDDLA